MMIENSTPVSENAFGSFGEFVDTPEWTDEEWAEYDAWLAEDIAKWDAEHEDEWMDAPF